MEERILNCISLSLFEHKGASEMTLQVFLHIMPDLSLAGRTCLPSDAPTQALGYIFQYFYLLFFIIMTIFP